MNEDTTTLPIRFQVVPEHQDDWPTGAELPTTDVATPPHAGDVFEIAGAGFWAVKWRRWDRNVGKGPGHLLTLGIAPSVDPATLGEVAKRPKTPLVMQ